MRRFASLVVVSILTTSCGSSTTTTTTTAVTTTIAPTTTTSTSTTTTATARTVPPMTTTSVALSGAVSYSSREIGKLAGAVDLIQRDRADLGLDPYEGRAAGSLVHAARAPAQNVPRRPRDSWMPYSVSWNWRA